LSLAALKADRMQQQKKKSSKNNVSSVQAVRIISQNGKTKYIIV
jgi:hypothetical protein